MSQREPVKVDPTDPAALEAWLVQASTVANELHELAVESTARKAKRRHARHWLRGCTMRRLRELRSLLGALTPAPQLKGGEP